MADQAAAAPVVADPAPAPVVADTAAAGTVDTAALKAAATVEGTGAKEEAKPDTKPAPGEAGAAGAKSPAKSPASSTKSAPTAKSRASSTQNPQRGMGGMGGMGGMMGMMGVPMTTMSTSNVDLPFLKNKLIQELSPYNIDEDRDTVISIIRSSDYIKELKKSQHKPTIFQEGMQDFIDGVQDKILKIPEGWKTEYTQAENTTTLNELFHNMLKKYKDSEEEGGEMTTTDLYSLYQISNNAQNCGSSPPPPKSSDSSKGPSMFSKLKNAASAATTRKNKPGDPAGTPGAPGTTPDGTPKKGMLANMKDKVNNFTRRKTPQEQAEALKKKEEAATEKQKKQDEAAAAKEAKKQADAAAAAALAEKVRSGNASKVEKLEHEKNKLVTGVKTSASNVATKASNQLNAAKTAVKTSASNAATAVKENAFNAYAKAADKVVTGIQDFKAKRTIAKYQGGGASASHHRTRYISDIKNNRRRLYDRERKIIQSIRNFENNNNNNNNNRHKSRHHKTRKLRNLLMRR